MKKVTILLSIILSSCSPSNDTSLKNIVSREPVSIGLFIDTNAGDPINPDLPEDIVGVTDEALESTNHKTLSDIIQKGLSFAQNNIEESPRYLCELGRIGVIINHPNSIYWLQESANHGSAIAWLYLGNLYLNDADFLNAKLEYSKALESGIDSSLVQPYLLEISSLENFEGFNRKDIIAALYNDDMTTLQENRLECSYYIGILHNTLWDINTLFYTDSKLHTKLDPNLSSNLGFYAEESHSAGVDRLMNLISTVINTEETKRYALISKQATQDARRLSILYSSYPKYFERVYAGAVKFSKLAKK